MDMKRKPAACPGVASVFNAALLSHHLKRPLDYVGKSHPDCVFLFVVCLFVCLFVCLGWVYFSFLSFFLWLVGWLILVLVLVFCLV